MEIQPEEPEKIEELMNSVVEKVDFKNAPELKLYEGIVEPFYDESEFRNVKKYDARVEVKKKKMQKRNQIEANKNIRETNVINRKVIDKKGKFFDLKYTCVTEKVREASTVSFFFQMKLNIKYIKGRFLIIMK